MKRYAAILGAMLAAGAVSLAADDDKEDDAKGKVTAEAVKKVADTVAKDPNWETLSRAGADLAAKHKPDHVMRPMKRRTDMFKSGLGIGPTPGAVNPDGIEAMFTFKMPKWEDPLPDDYLKKKEHFGRAADIIAAIATIATHQCPVKQKKEDKDPKDWEKWTRAMFDHSVALGKALREKAPDAKEIAKISKSLGMTCTDCHSVFRAE